MATEALAETILEEVADNLEEAAAVTRQIDARAVSFFLGGATFGLAVGFFFGYRYNREKIRAEAFRESEEDLEKLRQVYNQRIVAAQDKPSVEDLVEERGYSIPVRDEEEERPLRPPVPISGHPFAGMKNNQFPKRTADGEKSKDDGWDYEHELAQRTPSRPFIIHQDEFHLNESGYGQVTYTYYEGDGVLTEEDDTVINNPDNLVGIENLSRWGHGSDDFNVIHIRNTALEIEFEVCRSPKSYEEEVLGLEHSDTSNYERMRRRKDGPIDDEED